MGGPLGVGAATLLSPLLGAAPWLGTLLGAWCAGGALWLVLDGREAPPLPGPGPKPEAGPAQDPWRELGEGPVRPARRVAPRSAPLPEPTEAALAEGDPDARRLLGEFAAAARDTWEVGAIAEALMDTVVGILKPSHMAIFERGEAGGYFPLAGRGIEDWEAHEAQGPEPDSVAIPLRVGERLLGRLALGPKLAGGGYEAKELALLDNLGQSLALAMRNAQLVQELVGQERLKRELEIAAEVQMGLLPKLLPVLPGLELEASCKPALEVGGDFYDAVQIDPHRVGVLIGDVAGKGVPASLMMAVTLTLFRAMAPGIPSPALVLTRLNKLVHRNRPNRKTFVAAMYFIVDARDGSVLLANAGLPPLLMNGEALPAKGMPLGASQKTVYKELAFTLPPGGTLVGGSDGLEDAESPEGRSFGPEGLVEAIASFPGGTALALAQHLASALAMHQDGTPPPDDQTLAVLRRSPAPPPGGGQASLS